MAGATEIYRVGVVPVGQLFIMPRPRAEVLQQDVQHYQSLGVDALLSLLEEAEAAELGLSAEAQTCGVAGLEFLTFPIADYSVPQRGAFLTLVNDVAARLRAGQAVAVHCRAGIGRSGMVVCSVLGALGVKDAIAEVSRARGIAVPDTAEQRTFIQDILAEFV